MLSSEENIDSTINDIGNDEIKKQIKEIKDSTEKILDEENNIN